MLEFAESEHPELISHEIIFEGFQPMCNHDTSTSRPDGQTDDLIAVASRGKNRCSHVHRERTKFNFES